MSRIGGIMAESTTGIVMGTVMTTAIITGMKAVGNAGIDAMPRMAICDPWWPAGQASQRTGSSLSSLPSGASVSR